MRVEIIRIPSEGSQGISRRESLCYTLPPLQSGHTKYTGTDVEEIGNILPAFFKRRMRWGEPKLVELLAPLWHRVAGKPIAQCSRPTHFEAGILTLVTYCPSWAGQLRQMAEEIRAAVNSFLGKPIVRKLRVRYVPEALIAGHEKTTSTPQVLGQAKLPNPGLNCEGQLDPEIARVVELSFAKYFAHAAKRVN